MIFRNPFAYCENCVYFQEKKEFYSIKHYEDEKKIYQIRENSLGYCKRYPIAEKKYKYDYCGEHPEFTKKESHENENM